jgi:acyl-coenzyme A thioesterase PaaI-like protein
VLDESRSLQDQFAPDLICFGCGPANSHGLQIKSYVRGDRTFAEFQPQPHHQAYNGMVNGGILGAILDCHMNWTAAWWLMRQAAAQSPPCTVTAEFTVRFSAPTPSDQVLRLDAWIVEYSDKKVIVESSISAGGIGTASGKGTFVAVKPGHPAYHRW